MRTLQTLRSSCIDGQKLIEYNMVEHADEQTGTTTPYCSDSHRATRIGVLFTEWLNFF